ncbi:MAG: hypothetical protein C0418_06320 [Coriobacteriaceae bacterium]|nr:hypothetical protein [Coriobacteriaceae bacterium]
MRSAIYTAIVIDSVLLAGELERGGLVPRAPRSYGAPDPRARLPGVMRRLPVPAVLLAAALCLSACVATAPPASGRGAPAVARAVVTRVVDGDTIHVRMPDGSAEKVRLSAVDTPESTWEHEPFGKEASAYAKQTLASRTVYLETGPYLRDDYDRLLAFVWLDRPVDRSDVEVRAKMFNAALLADGYAEVYDKAQNRAYMDVFHRIEREARAARRGMWGL